MELLQNPDHHITTSASNASLITESNIQQDDGSKVDASMKEAVADASAEVTLSSAGKYSPPKKKNDVNICQECSQETFRYQCPRCSHRTCSLTCCVAHKKRTGCNGKRDRTKFLRVSHMNDATLASDYHFLEDALMGVERAKRSVEDGGHHVSMKRPKHNHPPGGDEATTNKNSVPHSMLQQMGQFEISSSKKESDSVAKDDGTDDTQGMKMLDISTQNANANTARQNPTPQQSSNTQTQLGPKWRNFKHQASLRGTNLLLMPSGMQRRKANTSHMNNKTNVLHWKVEVRLHPSEAKAPPTVHSIKICEDAVLCKELRAKLVGWRSSTQSKVSSIMPPLKQEPTETEPIHWLMQILPRPSNRQSYVEISDTEETTLQSVLKGRTVIEYPTVEGVPESRLGDFPKNIQEVQDK